MTQTIADFTPFRILGEAGASPLVFASPHSGCAYPTEMAGRSTLTEPELRSAEDALVDRLVEPSAAANSVPMLLAAVGRAYVDLNRSPDDLDPLVIEGATGQGPRVAAGYGVIPRLSGAGEPLYDRRLSMAEAKARVETFHAPYHAALDTLMRAARDRYGVAVLVDWHSMPARAATARGAARPVDAVLGDRHGSAAAREVTRGVEYLLERGGWRVALNHPYAGGYSTQLWGRPEEGFHAVQVELNRALYLDEAMLEPNSGFDRTAAIIGRVVQSLAARDWPSVLRV